jgi:hypothetical protein
MVISMLVYIKPDCFMLFSVTKDILQGNRLASVDEEHIRLLLAKGFIHSVIITAFGECPVSAAFF